MAPGRRDAGARGVRGLYTLLFHAAAPFLLARLYWKGRRQPGYRERIAERFGRYPADAALVDLWLHAVSVGECEAAFPVVLALLARPAPPRILVTCTTPTGAARLRAVLGERVQHVYLPYDLPGAVNRFLDRFQPRLAVVLETELWPNLFQACRARAIPLVILNGRLSAKSARAYARLPGLMRATLAAVTRVAAQTEADAQRYLAIGARPERVEVMGNIKFELDFDTERQAAATALRRSLFGDRPVWIAGSTHPGEEALLLDAQAELRQVFPGLLLILAPRHPERAPELRALCARHGQAVASRSAGQPCPPDTPVFLIDGIGELRLFYGAADVAFIGGSLVPHGGQNPLEAAVAGRPVLFGPHMANFRDIAERLTHTGAARRLSGPAALVPALRDCLERPAEAAAMGRQGQAFVAANRGARDRFLALIDSLWTPAP